MTLKEMVLKQLDMKRQLSELSKQINEKVIADYAKYQVGSVAPHDYRSGGEMIVDKVEVLDYFRRHDGEYSFSLHYRGRAINKDGKVGEMKVANFDEGNKAIKFNIGDIKE